MGNEKSWVGVFGFLNGDVYSGGFLEDLGRGSGEMSYNEGGVWRGEFLEGVKWARESIFGRVGRLSIEIVLGITSIATLGNIMIWI